MARLHRRTTAAIGLLLIAAGCGRNGTAADATAESMAPRPQTFGRADLPAAAQRVVEIRMGDDLRFEPAEIRVRKGEVVTFRLVNTGRQFHEFTVGGPEAQELHDDQMATMDMSGRGSGMAMGDPGAGMHDMTHEPGHDKYMKRLAQRIAFLDRQAAANDSVHVPPGETHDLTWAFTGERAPVFGCHVVGHWAAGMKGTFTLEG